MRFNVRQDAFSREDTFQNQQNSQLLLLPWDQSYVWKKKCPQWFPDKMEFIFSVIMQRWPHRLFWFLRRIDVLMILNSCIAPLGRGTILSYVSGLPEDMEKWYQPCLLPPAVFERRVRSLYQKLVCFRILCSPTKFSVQEKNWPEAERCYLHLGKMVRKSGSGCLLGWPIPGSLSGSLTDNQQQRH